MVEVLSAFPIDTSIRGKRVLYDRCFKKGYDFVLAFNDVREFLKDVEPNTATLIVTSPPYNLGKAYEKRIEFKQYLDWQKDVAKRCVDILKPEGSLCWEIGNYVEDGELFPLDVFFYDIFKSLGL